MRVTYSSEPKNYEIKGEFLILTELLEIEQTDEGTIYHANEYILPITPRPNLEESVANNLQLWLEKAKVVEHDKLADEVRAERNKRLAETDFWFLGDRELSQEHADALKAYRQALRDITEQAGFPYEVIWPEVVE